MISTIYNGIIYLPNTLRKGESYEKDPKKKRRYSGIWLKKIEVAINKAANAVSFKDFNGGKQLSEKVESILDETFTNTIPLRDRKSVV